MAHFIFFGNSIATLVPPPLFWSICLISLFNMFWAIQLELLVMLILRKCAKLQKKKTVMECFFLLSLLTASKFTEVESYDYRFPWNHWDHLLMDFPKQLLYMESLKIIDKFCSGPLENFLNMACIFIQVIRNCSQMFFKIGVLKSFASFTGKHLCWSLFW